MASLTTEQQTLVNNNRKNPTPSYYSAALKADTIISYDFEAYLILLSDSVKDQIISQLKSAKSSSTIRKDRDDLLTIAFTSELTDAQNRYNLLSTQLQSFTTFRNSLDVSNFQTVSEIGTLINDLQLTLGEDLLSLDRMQHLNTFTTVVQTLYNNGQINADTLKELDSFITLINSYKGAK